MGTCLDTVLPRKLKKDAILECVFEVQFESDEITEILIGNICSHEKWRQYQKNRLPVANIPEPVREQDENLKFQPLIELQGENKTRLVRVGGHAFSLHLFSPYPGWPSFFPEIKEAVKFLCENVNNFKTKRIGLRYVNALDTNDHGVRSLSDLNLAISINQDNLSKAFNLNYATLCDESDTTALVRIGSKPFLVGNFKSSNIYLVDIDISSESNFSTAQEIENWVDKAHVYEKKEFFRLLSPGIVNALKEDA